MEGKIPYQNGQPYSQQCRFRLSKVRYFAFFLPQKKLRISGKRCTFVVVKMAYIHQKSEYG